MSETKKPSPSKDALLALGALQKAVNDAIEKKRRLGQYAVVWEDGKPKILDFSDRKPEGKPMEK